MIDVLYAVLAAVFFFCGFHLLQRRHITYLIAGIILMSHGVNLTLLLSAELKKNADPFAKEGTETAAVADPLPQALILTAIVITFALVAFALVTHQQYAEMSGQEDVHELDEEPENDLDGRDV